MKNWIIYSKSYPSKESVRTVFRNLTMKLISCVTILVIKTSTNKHVRLACMIQIVSNAPYVVRLQPILPTFDTIINTMPPEDFNVWNVNIMLTLWLRSEDTCRSIWISNYSPVNFVIDNILIPNHWRNTLSDHIEVCENNILCYIFYIFYSFQVKPHTYVASVWVLSRIWISSNVIWKHTMKRLHWKEVILESCLIWEPELLQPGKLYPEHFSFEGRKGREDDLKIITFPNFSLNLKGIRMNQS